MVTLQLDPTVVSKLKKCTELSDVVVKYGDKEYHLHKFILSASSQYFFAAFTNWSNDTIDLSQVPFDKDVLEALFDIIYGAFEFGQIGKYVEAGHSIGMLKKALDFFMMASQETLLYDGIQGYFKDVVGDPEKMMSLIVSVADLLSTEWNDSTMLYFKSYLQAHAYTSLKDVFDRLPFSLASLLLTDGFAVPSEQTRLDLFMSVYEKLEGQEKSEFRIMLLNCIYAPKTNPEIMWKLVETLEDSKMLVFTESPSHPGFALSPRHPLTYGRKIKVGVHAKLMFPITYSGVKMNLHVTESRDGKAQFFIEFSPSLTDKICDYSLKIISDEYPFSTTIIQTNDLQRQRKAIFRFGDLPTCGWQDAEIKVGKCYVVLFTFCKFIKI